MHGETIKKKDRSSEFLVENFQKQENEDLDPAQTRIYWRT